MGDLWYLALAYGVIWTGLLGYVFRLSRRAEGLQQELDLLRQMLKPDEGDGMPPEIGEAEAQGLPASTVGQSPAQTA
ncbi:MAG: CcmD family protein [Chloroflexi bacterium]|nr:CcmD family protein [Chloroflexota bacterium]